MQKDIKLHTKWKVKISYKRKIEKYDEPYSKKKYT